MNNDQKGTAGYQEAAQDYQNLIYISERRLGVPFKWLLFLLGMILVWGMGQPHSSSLVLFSFTLYGMSNVLFSYIFYAEVKPALPATRALLLLSLLADILFCSVLIYFTGGAGSELYLLYCLLAFKAAFYYPIWTLLLTPLYLSGPFYAFTIYYSSRSFYFLLDRSFLARYALLFAVTLTATYLGWLIEDRQKWILVLADGLSRTRQDVESKTQLIQRTAQDLGNRVMELRSLQEGVKAINSALALESVLRLIVTNASQVLDGARCSVALLDEQRQEVIIRAASGAPPEKAWETRFKIGEGVIGWVVQNSRPVLVGNVKQDKRFVQTGYELVGSLMTVPLVSDNVTIGALSATSPRLNAFDVEDLQRLEAFADQAAIAVKNSRLYERLAEEKRQTEQNMRQIMAVNEVSRALVSLLNIDEILQLIIERLAHLAGTSHCAVAFLDEGKRELTGVVARGQGGERFRHYRIHLSDDPAVAQAVQDRHPKLADRADISPHPAQKHLAQMWRIRSYLVAPLIAKDRAIGVLYLADSRVDFTFGEQEFQLITSFSHFAAAAIENAQLYQSVWEKSTELEAILRGIGDGVIVTDPGLHLLLMNPVAVRIFRLNQEIAAGTYLPEIIHNESVTALLQEALESQEHVAIKEIVVPAPQEGMRDMVYQGLASTVSKADGQIRGIVTLLRDITSQKELERMKSNFLSVVSHELKTPLHSIKGFVDIILMGKTGEVNELQRDFLMTVKQQTGQLQTLINDLLEFSRLEAGQIKLHLEQVSLPEIAERVVEKLKPLADDAKIELKTTLSPELAFVEADQMRLEQVLTNLVDNAIKFTPAGGLITIEGQDLGDQVQISVRDTGIGIPPEEQEKIFDRFYQVDRGPRHSRRGTGLGLTICKHIIAHHHGRIWVESKLGEGSVFHFIIPKVLPKEEEPSLDFTRLPTQHGL